MEDNGKRDKKSKTNWSLFPSAKTIIDEYEQRLESTVKVEPNQNLIDASKRGLEVRCEKCEKVDETGLLWTKISLLDNESSGDMIDIWYCDRCLVKKPDINTRYTFSSSEIDNSVEKITLPFVKKTKAADGKKNNDFSKRKHNK